MNNRLMLFAPNFKAVSETFIRGHINKLPFNVVPRYGIKWGITNEDGGKIYPTLYWLGKFLERVSPKYDQYLFDNVLALHLRRGNPRYVLAEFGVTGAWVVSACKLAKVPLFVIFHGFDASVYEVIEKHKEKYEEIFEYASGIVAVSKVMRDKLISMGAPAHKVHWTPCGVDPNHFTVGDVKNSQPVFVGVGRFVEKKAPYLTILAFKKALDVVPESKLRLIGNGPLLGPCKRLADSLKIKHAVDFLGPQDPDVVVKEMNNARAFVQHSLVAENGDSEGTPVAAIEAQMAGLPVISTLHAGIPDVVIDKETGFLVDESDVDSMASAMIALAKDPQLACRMGEAGHHRVVNNFTLDHHIEFLQKIISAN